MAIFDQPKTLNSWPRGTKFKIQVEGFMNIYNHAFCFSHMYMKVKKFFFLIWPFYCIFGPVHEALGR